MWGPLESALAPLRRPARAILYEKHKYANIGVHTCGDMYNRIKDIRPNSHALNQTANKLT